MDKFVLEKISGIDWNAVCQRLMAVSVFWSKIYHGNKWDRLPKGYTHNDVVQEAIRRAFTRDWPNYNEGEFNDFLFGSIRSIVSNLARSAKVQRTDNMDLFDLKIRDDNDIEYEFDHDEVIKRIWAEIGDYKKLKVLFQNILIGLEPREISEILQAPIAEVYNLKKRLLRIVEKIANELANYVRK